MAGTEKLYYKEPNATEFTATVIENREVPEGRLVYLDRTLFYPEGGGQPADRGWLNGIPVRDVQKDDDGRIAHLVDRLPEDHRVNGKIEWSHRADYMQQHSGQHIISAAFMKTGPYNTVSVHLGEEYVTVEVDAESIPEEKLAETEDVANTAVLENLPLDVHWTTDRDIGTFPLRRPPKVSGDIRLVQIPDFDCVACGGLHVGRTGEVRLIQLIGAEKIRGHVRTVWKIGDRALRDYRQKTRIVNELSTALSAQQAAIPARVEALQQAAQEAKKQAAAYQQRIAELMTEKLLESGVHSGRYLVVTRAFSAEEKDTFRRLIETLSERENVIACLTNTIPSGIQWAVCLPESTGISFNSVREKTLPLIGGKGGGKPPLYQGAGSSPEQTGAFLESFKRLVRSAVS